MWTEILFYSKEKKIRVTRNIIEYLSGVKFHCKPPGVPEGFRAAAFVNDSGESNNNWCLNSRSSKEISTTEVSYVMSDLKKSLGTGTPSMDDTFWDPLTIKISKFFNQMVILKENWACKIA